MSIRLREWTDRHGKHHEAWQVMIHQRGPDGQVVSHNRTLAQGMRKRDAEDHETEIRGQILRGEFQRRKTEQAKAAPKLQDFWPEFLRFSEKVAKNSPSEMACKRKAERYILPRLGDHRLDQIGTREMERLCADMADVGLSPKTQRSYLYTLKRCLRKAQDYGHILGVPRTETIRVPKSEVKPFTREETERLYQSCDDPDVRLMILIAWRMGLRIGEVLALQWEDINLKTATLTLRHSQRRWRTPEGVYVVELGPTKTAAFLDRPPELPVPLDVMVALQGLKRTGPFVLGGDHMITDTETRRSLERACRKAGLPIVGWHALRHAFATQMIEGGAPLPVVSKMLTHTTVEMTMRYVTVSADALRTWADRGAPTPPKSLDIHVTQGGDRT